jgi:hypothetical protein
MTESSAPGTTVISSCYALLVSALANRKNSQSHLAHETRHFILKAHATRRTVICLFMPPSLHSCLYWPCTETWPLTAYCAVIMVKSINWDKDRRMCIRCVTQLLSLPQCNCNHCATPYSILHFLLAVEKACKKVSVYTSYSTSSLSMIFFINICKCCC